MKLTDLHDMDGFHHDVNARPRRSSGMPSLRRGAEAGVDRLLG